MLQVVGSQCLFHFKKVYDLLIYRRTIHVV